MYNHKSTRLIHDVFEDDDSMFSYPKKPHLLTRIKSGLQKDRSLRSKPSNMPLQSHKFREGEAQTLLLRLKSRR
ncbi:hypothetical protein BH23PAT1_BH23PAT1_4890 [soil metagenome]